MTSISQGSIAPNFTLSDSSGKKVCLYELAKETSVLVGFADDVWSINSVRRVLWLQRHMLKMAMNSIWAVFVVPNDLVDVQAFERSIPRTLAFPILADATHETVASYEMSRKAGFMLVSPNKTIKRIWVGEGGFPSMRDVLLLSQEK